jgi:hypothetical protein
LSSLWRYRYLSLIIVIAFACAGAATAVLRPSPPTAVARMGLANPRSLSLFLGGSSSGADLGRYAAAQVRFTQSAAVMQAASSGLGGGVTAAKLLPDVTVAASATADVVSVTATGRSSAEAARRANAVVAAYQQLTLGRARDAVTRELASVAAERVQLANQIRAARSNSTLDRASVAAATSALNALEQSANEAQTEAALFGSGTEFVDAAAATPGRGLLGGIAHDGPIGALVGLLVAGAAAWIRAGRRREVATGAEAAELMGVPVLGEIPTAGPRAPAGLLGVPAGIPEQAYHGVAAALCALSPRGLFVVVGPARHDGRTVTTLGVAAALASSGTRVAVVDADLRTAHLSRLLRLDDEAGGLAEVAGGEADLLDVTHVVPAGARGELAAVGAGRPAAQPAGLLRTPETVEALRRLRATFDVVLVDTPAAGTTCDALGLAREANGMIAVVRRRTPRRPLCELHRQAEVAGAPLIGLVFTFDAARRDGYGARGGPVPRAREAAGPSAAGPSAAGPSAASPAPAHAVRTAR